MIDPENALLGESAGNRVVDFATRLQVRPQGFFERHPHLWAGQACRGQPVDHWLEQGRRGRQEDGEALFRVDSLGQRGESLRVLGVERNVGQPRHEPLGHQGGVEIVRDVLGERFAGNIAIGRVVMSGARRGDDLEIVRQQPVGVEPIERRQQHPPGEVSGRSEQEQSLDFFGDHRAVPSRGRRSASS